MSMPIRWGDMDAFGHVNNTVYFRYMEQVRISWLESLSIASEESSTGEGPVIINANMTFLRQLRYPGDIDCRMFIGTPGRSSVGACWASACWTCPGCIRAERCGLGGRAQRQR